MTLAGCGQEKLEIRGHQDTTQADFGANALRAAAAEAGAAPGSPEAYRQFADQVRALRPRFDETTRAEADRLLAFLAVGPMQALELASPDERLRALATTVWPTLLGGEPRPGEDANTFLTRACRHDLAGLCKRVVPEAWPRVLGAAAWQKLAERAQAAYDDCDACQGDPSYTRALAVIRDRHTRAGAAAEVAKKRAAPRSWPTVGGHVRKPVRAPVVRVDGGVMVLDGVARKGKSWLSVLRLARPTGPVLGVHLAPGDRVRRLRRIMKLARRAGFEHVELLARHAQYPYALSGVRLPLTKALALPAHGDDTIQVLVQGLGDVSVPPPSVGLSM